MTLQETLVLAALVLCACGVCVLLVAESRDARRHLTRQMPATRREDDPEVQRYHAALRTIAHWDREPDRIARSERGFVLVNLSAYREGRGR